jgi:hypothetical protein
VVGDKDAFATAHDAGVSGNSGGGCCCRPASDIECAASMSGSLTSAVPGMLGTGCCAPECTLSRVSIVRLLAFPIDGRREWGGDGWKGGKGRAKGRPPSSSEGRGGHQARRSSGRNEEGEKHLCVGCVSLFDECVRGCGDSGPTKACALERSARPAAYTVVARPLRPPLSSMQACPFRASCPHPFLCLLCVLA